MEQAHLNCDLLGNPSVPSHPPAGRLSRLGPATCLGFASLFAAVLCGLSFALDESVSSFARSIDLPGDLQKAIQLSEAFAHGFGAAFILFSVWLVAIERRKLVWLAILTTACSGVAANGMKSLAVRIRPYAVEDIQVGTPQRTKLSNNEAVGNNNKLAMPKTIVAPSFWDARQRSFPSGHAATAVGLAIGLSLIFPRGMLIFGILAGLACVQRLTSGAHFLSDVLAGSAIAFGCSATLLALPMYKRIRRLLREESAIQETNIQETNIQP